MSDEPADLRGGRASSLDAADAVVERIRAAVVSTARPRGARRRTAASPGSSRRRSATRCSSAALRRRRHEGAAGPRRRAAARGLGIDLVAMSVERRDHQRRPAGLLPRPTSPAAGSTRSGSPSSWRASPRAAAWPAASLLGGETAEHPGHDGARRVRPRRLLRRRLRAARAGVGRPHRGAATPSSACRRAAPHSNGFSLVRSLLERAAPGSTRRRAELGGASVADALLEPTAIYARAVARAHAHGGRPRDGAHHRRRHPGQPAAPVPGRPAARGST